MIRKTISPLCGQVRVTFELPSCLWADRIYVSGEFNNWDELQNRMRQDRDGIWRVAIDLPANRQFEFRYVVDGKWQTDNHADGSRANKYGSENSVVDTSLSGVENFRARHADIAELPQGSLIHEAKVGAAPAMRSLTTRKVMKAA